MLNAVSNLYVTPLGADATGGYLASRPADGRDVSQVIDLIQRSFGSSGYVSTSELKQIKSAIHALNPNERKLLINTLGSNEYRGALDTLMGEFILPGYGDRNGLSKADRLSLYADLTEYQGGQIVADIARSIGRVPGTQNNDFKSTVTQPQLEFIDTLAFVKNRGGVGSSKQKSETVQQLAGKGGIAQANAELIARMISTLDTKTAGGKQALDQILQVLASPPDKARTRVAAILDAVNPLQINVDQSVTRSYDMQPLTALLSRVAASTSNPMRALFFTMASERYSQTLGKLAQSELNVRPALDALARLVTADTNGVMKIVFDQGAYMSGKNINLGVSGHKAFKEFAQAMIVAGQPGSIRIMLEQIQRGNGLDESPQARMGLQNPYRTETQSQAIIANRLGQAVGAVSEAVRSTESSGINQTRVLLAFTAALNSFHKDFSVEVTKIFTKLPASAFTAVVGTGLFLIANEQTKQSQERGKAQIGQLLGVYTPRIETPTRDYATGQQGNLGIQSAFLAGRARNATLY